MKKAIGIAVLAALIVSLSGCANMDHPQPIQDSSGIEVVTNEIDERTEPEESSPASVSESKESSVDSTATIKAETESVQSENSQPIAEQSPASGTQSPQTVVPPDTPKTVEPTPEPKSSPTQQPTPPPAEKKRRLNLHGLNRRRKPRRPKNLPFPNLIFRLGSTMPKITLRVLDCSLKAQRLTAGTIQLPQAHTALVWNGTFKAGWIGTVGTKILPMSGYGWRNAPTGATICISATLKQNQNRIFHDERTV